MTPEEIFDLFTEQITLCHLNAEREGVFQPDLRSIMTRKTRNLFLRHEEFQRIYAAACPFPNDECDFEFRGSLVTIVAGTDYFFHTRCINLPEP